MAFKPFFKKQAEKEAGAPDPKDADKKAPTGPFTKKGAGPVMGSVCCGKGCKRAGY